MLYFLNDITIRVSETQRRELTNVYNCILAGGLSIHFWIDDTKWGCKFNIICWTYSEHMEFFHGGVEETLFTRDI